MSGSLLSEKQRTELNRSLVAYLSSQSVPHDTIARIAKDLDVPLVPDANENKKQAQIIEKKWTSVVRLQRKVLELEAQVTTLKSELENVSSGSGALGGSRKPADVVSWLPRTPRHTLSSHRQPVTAVAFHSVFSALASACEDGTIKVWDWELGELERTIKAHTKAVVDVDYGGQPGEEILASCSSDLTIKLWDPQNDYANIKTLSGHDHTISSVRFTPNGAYLISASRDKTLRVWDVKSGYAVRTIHGHSDWVKTVCPSIDSEYALSAGIDQTARISSISTGETKLVLIGHEHVIESAEFAPRSAYKYLASIEGLKKPVESSFSSSFEYAATASRDKTIKLWNTRGEVIKTLSGHDNWVRQVAFHPGGKYLISVSDDKSMRCWDLSQQGRCVKVISEAHNHFVSCLRWAPRIASVNESTNNDHDDNESNDKDLKGVRLVLATGSVDLDVKIW